MGSIKESIDLTNTNDQAKFFRYASVLLNDIVAVINGGIEINSSNMNLVIISCTFTAANTNTTFSHGLERVPSYYIVCKSSVSAGIYTGTTAFTSSTVTLKSSAAGTFSIILF